MRDMRQGICSLCGHNEIVLAWPRDFGANGGSISMAVTHQFAGILDKKDFASGVLHVCCCRKCGYTQWFAHEPQGMEIGAEFGTQLITGPAPAR